MEVKEQRKVDPFIVYAMAAADEALKDAGWAPKSHEDQCATGVLIGSGIGGIGGIYDASVTLHEKGPRGSRRSSSRAGSSTSPPARSRSPTASRARTTPW